MSLSRISVAAGKALALGMVLVALSACAPQTEANPAPEPKPVAASPSSKPRIPSAPTSPGKTSTAAEPMPEWLHARIADIQREPVSNPPASFVRYRIDGAVYYLRPARCCDIQSELYDANGNEVCRPDGGITGQGDGRCPWFHDAAGEPEVVWRDKRSRRMQSDKPASGQ